MRWGEPFESDLERAITEERKAKALEAFALEAFTSDELAALSPARRRVLDMLLKRQLRDSLDPGIAEALRVRRQFEDYCDNQSSSAVSLRLSAQLR